MSAPDGIFISYRRIDTNWAAVYLRHHIARHLPGVPVFMDIESIAPGEDFVEVIHQNVDRCRIMLAVIGPNWLTVSNNFGQRRLDDPNDFVRLEIGRALERKIRLIPIQVDGARMPPAHVLPAPLQPLARRNAVTVDHHSHARDLDMIVEALEKAFPGQRRDPSQTERMEPRPEPSADTPSAPQTQIGAEVAQALLDAGTDAKTMLSVAQLRYDKGQYAVEMAIRQAAQPLLEASDGQEGEWSLANRHNTAHALLNLGRIAEAEAAFRALIPIRERVQGAEHPSTLTTRHEQARALLNLGRTADAEAAFRALIPIRERVEGAEHPHTLTTRHAHASALLNLGRAAEAEAAFRALIPIRERVQGAEHPGTLTTRRQWARAALEIGDIGIARRALAAIPDDVGDPDPVAKWRHRFLQGWIADLDGDADRATALLDRAERLLGDRDPNHYARRELAKYRETRVPGAAGGTTLWAAGGA